MSLRPAGQDRRFWPEALGVAHESLRGRLAGAEFTAGTAKRVWFPLVGLHAAPDGPLDRQLPHGTAFQLIVTQAAWAFGFEIASGYCGWVRAAHLADPQEAATHWVAAPLSNRYARPDLKGTHRSHEHLPFLAQVTVWHRDGDFASIRAAGDAWHPAPHLRPLGEVLADPAEVVRMFLNAPYFWGGDSALGIDCSGLVHAARSACGLPCPRDSDLQAAMPGQDLAPGAEAPGDLVFWKGHVAMVTGPDRIIHANAFHMAVVEEPLSAAETRIGARGGGPVTRRLRPD